MGEALLEVGSGQMGEALLRVRSGHMSDVAAPGERGQHD